MGSSLAVVGGALVLVAAFAAGYYIREVPTRPRVVTLERPLELSTRAQASCVLPKGTVLEYEGTLGAEGISRYVLYVNVKDGYLPEPKTASHRGFRAPINAIERWDEDSPVEHEP